MQGAEGLGWRALLSFFSLVFCFLSFLRFLDFTPLGRLSGIEEGGESLANVVVYLNVPSLHHIITSHRIITHR